MKIFGKFKKDFIILFFLIVFIGQYFNFFYNFYFVFNNTYTKRMEYHYGYCAKESYGYLSKINKKFIINDNIKILNNELFPSSNWFFWKDKVNVDENYLIILNYHIKINQDGDKKQISENINLANYDVLDKEGNCFFLKKK